MSMIKIMPVPGEDPKKLAEICPFNSIVCVDGKLEIDSGCRMCKACVIKRPDVFQWIDEAVLNSVDKSLWKGIAIYVEQTEGKIHPVSLELIGKAKELAGKISQPVYCLLIGQNLLSVAQELLEYGVDRILFYDYPELKYFRIEPYSAAFEDFINKIKPSSILVGGTPIGRSLAPRLAARFRTGLTADCTLLDVAENTDIDQIRPAYGGNIMAHIHTPNHRPQFATVRYKIFNPPEKCKPEGRIELCSLEPSKLESAIEVLEVKPKEKVKSIEDAETIVVVGKGLKKKADLNMIYTLADSLGAMVAGTRPLIEQGWFDSRSQIGLSGRTVKPKLIITCGVSGSVQFSAGMQGADNIIAINSDPNAPIFEVAHFSVVGDIYEVVPALIKKIEKNGLRI